MRIIKIFALLCLATVAALLTDSSWLSGDELARQAESVTPIRALLITGGCCHDYATQKRIISEGVSARANVQWTIVHDVEADLDKSRTRQIPIYHEPGFWKDYDVIVHNECLGGLEDDAFLEKIAQVHSEHGVPAVMLHCSTHSYRAAKTDAWRKVLGVSSYSHEKNRDLTVRNIAPQHPIMQGFPNQWLDKADELYKVEKFWPTATPLAVAYGQDTMRDHTCIWTNQYGKARVFSTTLGHSNSTMEDPVYLDLVTRGLLWACEKLADNGQPFPGYSATK
jgi:type 1 glutamine amidotransferase